MEIHNYPATNENLLPCPFCGSKPMWYLKGTDKPGYKRTVTVCCPMCGTHQETGVIHSTTEFGCNIAIKKWNKRTLIEK